MSIFTIGLACTLLVEVEAPNMEEALKATNYVGHLDESSDAEKAELGFRILGIELVDNDAFDAT
ncbi:MAG: hypothetical protein COS37_00735 [Anaerolineae bacterium CG03_land_8_20_14_0_80_58_20]|nr:MAG: hypothetical protein AUJ21_10365 [Anaerolineae bacterium CG1_02_58_13]PIV28545.1 MAG: hypothetical protein COS37_00735 [Anaerolineae bacterium CG03_land_8_20_14_0_80_58_20]